MLTERQKKDADLILKPDRWPAWPLLPMKRYTGCGPGLETGVITASSDNAPKPRVYNANIYDVKAVIHAVGKRNVVAAYDDVESMLLDGWMVD